MHRPFREDTPGAVVATQLALLGGFALLSAHTLFGLGGAGSSQLFNHWLYDGLMAGGACVCMARAAWLREERPAWTLIGVGMLLWSLGDIYWTAVLANLENPPIPSLADAGYLAFYPLTLTGIALLARARMERVRATLWLDGLIAALALTAIGTELLIAAVFRNADVTGLKMVFSLAYPIGDTVLISFAAALLMITGRLPGRAWALIIVGLASNALADAIYSSQVYTSSYVEGAWLDLLWPLSAIALASAAWQARQRVVGRVASGGWRAYTVPALFAAVITVRLLLQPLVPFNPVAEFVVALMLVVIVVRFIVALAHNQQLLERVETDPLTRLGNRGKLLEDLGQVLDARRPYVLSMFDLDGFKRYNDSFGHPAGDALLERLGGRLAASLPKDADAYRIGGDEFCILVPNGESHAPGVPERAAAALAEQGEEFVVTASFGTVEVPDEAITASSALQIADKRMYAHKDARRESAGGQAKAVLLGALRESQPDLSKHVRDVCELAVAVGTELGLDRGELIALSRAAELHDIGKVAIPDAILEKPGPLNAAEWEFMKQHTILGERILASAPALAHLAPFVRSSHEHIDGSGYPDGLAGEEIPLISRIILACDAFAAMTSERPYAAAHSEESACRELRRCAGTQFDPGIVDAIVRVVGEQGAREETALAQAG
jgi:two-component system cell cycle response regulator